MKIEKLQDVSDCLILSGKFKDRNDFLDFKLDLMEFLRDFDKNEPICFFLMHMHPVELYFVGYLLKLKEFDSWNIKIHTNDIKISRFFEEVGLSEKFEVVLRDL